MMLPVMILAAFFGLSPALADGRTQDSRTPLPETVVRERLSIEYDSRPLEGVKHMDQELATSLTFKLGE